jgi:hypothetical protein
LGSAAAVNTILPLQVIDSNAFLNLGTVISPISNARNGTTIMNIQLELDTGEETTYEVQKGSLLQLPIPAGISATLHMEILRKVELDGRRKEGKQIIQVIGGVCGAVIDARGRPLVLPSDAARRRDTLQKWSDNLGN